MNCNSMRTEIYSHDVYRPALVDKLGVERTEGKDKDKKTTMRLLQITK